MYKLLKKSILSNKKYFISGLVVALVCSAVQYDGIEYYLASLMMCFLWLFVFWVDKLCYIEDNNDTRIFLLSLPISKYDLIKEKNIIMYICILVGIIMVHLIGFIINCIFGITVTYNVESIISAIIITIFYSTIYIFLNYKFDYSKVKFSTYIVFAIMFFYFKDGRSISDLSFNITNLIIILVLMVFMNLSVTHFFSMKIFK